MNSWPVTYILECQLGPDLSLPERRLLALSMPRQSDSTAHDLPPIVSASLLLLLLSQAVAALLHGALSTWAAPSA